MHSTERTKKTFHVSCVSVQHYLGKNSSCSVSALCQTNLKWPVATTRIRDIEMHSDVTNWKQSQKKLFLRKGSLSLSGTLNNYSLCLKNWRTWKMISRFFCLGAIVSLMQKKALLEQFFNWSMNFTWVILYSSKNVKNAYLYFLRFFFIWELFKSITRVILLDILASSVSWA